MAKIKIKGVHEYDLVTLEKGNQTIYYVSYSNGEQWNKHVRGAVAMIVKDTGSGLKFLQLKKGFLGYDEAEILRILLNKYIKP